MIETSLARSAQEEFPELVECFRHEGEECPRCDGSGYSPVKDDVENSACTHDNIPRRRPFIRGAGGYGPPSGPPPATRPLRCRGLRR